MVDDEWRSHYRCPRCSGKIVSNPFPRNAVEDVVTVLLVLLAALVEPVARSGDYFAAYMSGMVVLAVFIGYREYQRHQQKREWKRWLPGGEH